MKKAVVVGLAKSGISAARLLAGCGYSVFITEIKKDAQVLKAADSLIIDNVVKEGDIELGSHSGKFIEGAGLMVLSPGVHHDSTAVKLAGEMGISIISELELAYSMCPLPVIAITGTNGKTTVTTLIGEMLKRHGIETVICGNIGSPFSGEVRNVKKGSIVALEVSSFQLEWTRSFKPWISVILNISENHLDRHKDFEEYVSLKARIFSNQGPDDITFLNGRDGILRGLVPRIRSRLEFFDEYRDFKGRYNIQNENYLAALSVGSAAGMDEKVMLDVISRFKGIGHRLEYVATVNGVDFINDSKSTTVSSVEWALRSLDGRIRLIMGGRYKGGDFGKLKYLIRKKVDTVVAIGEAGSRIKDALSPFKEVVHVQGKNLAEAVRSAFKNACKGDKILLSPGCSSFDMFENYEERGRVFKDICLKLSSI